jgi:hypothetical protein
MKIKLLGIDFTLGKGISLNDLFDHIKKTGDAGFELGGYGRFLYISDMDGYHVGLLITTKNHKKFLEFKADKANAKLEARDVSVGSKFADFNFFAINKNTGKGIYQYYHNSCSLNMFGMLCRAHYESLKDLRLENAKAQAQNLTSKVEKAIREQYSGSLKWDIVVRKETFDKLIEEYKSISAVTLNVSTMAYEDTAFTPLSHEANKMTQRYTFSKGTAVGSLINGIREVISRANVDGAKVEGVDEDGLERIIKLANTPDSFGEFDFDGVAETMAITPNDFVASSFLMELIEVAKAAPALQG